MSIKTKYDESKAAKGKIFTNVPRDFTLVTANEAIITAVKRSEKTYDLQINSGAKTFDSAAMRELATHLLELADIVDKKITF